ncbi:hypothetical protein BB560_000126 [Smittium megazygosporum]|uniref:Prolyl 4-hydroxylase alpha subunit domain-containing protein n=1 Tax=Smittium megazygosporum TaxID=133381 RepID=A0A2T9ZLD5_9FUNG|nr:hypothetical protein BB560_000126 [Smittium megazygosporum]
MPDDLQPSSKKQRIDAVGRKNRASADRLRLPGFFMNESFKQLFRSAFLDKEDFGEKSIYTDYMDKFFVQESENTDNVSMSENHTMKKISSIIGSPFRVGMLTNIFPMNWLLELKHELSLLEWKHRSNDLYDFYQTDDLTLVSSKYKRIASLHNFLIDDTFVSFLEELSGTKLIRGRIDMAAQQYKKGGYLLCHDDAVTDWNLQDGGCLGLFTKDENGQPKAVVKENLPVFNSVAFFITGESSFHEVQEVLRDDGTPRWSVTGWFYEDIQDLDSDDNSKENEVELSGKYNLCPEPTELKSYGENDQMSVLEKYISQDYLKKENKEKLSEIFLENSSVEMKEFLKEEVYNKLVERLCENEGWEESWNEDPELPPNIKRYYTLNPQKLQEPGSEENDRDLGFVSDIAKFFESAEFSEYLKEITNLNISKAIKEVRMFTPKCYTMMHDKVIEPEGLDVVFNFMRKSSVSNNNLERTKWDSKKWHGTTHYVEDEDELLTIDPDHNTLSLAYRTKETKKFVKYVKSSAEFARCEVSMTFVE